MDNTKIGVAQINTSSGNIEYNSKKIIQFIKQAQELELDLVIFPELSILGYPLGDTIGRYPVVAKNNIKWLNGITKYTENISVLVGFVECENDKLYDSIAYVKNKTIEKIIRKNKIDCQCGFNDSKYFSDISDNDNIIKIKNTMYAISQNNGCIYNNADVVIDCQSIPNHTEYKPHTNKLTIFVNQVGNTDNVTFKGESAIYDEFGNISIKAKSFEEDLLVFTFPLNDKNSNLTQANLSKTEFSLDYEKELEITYKNAIQGIRDYFSKTGFQRAVLGLSGGLDSTICAVLLADALGKENVFGISMPSNITTNESKNDAKILAENLGIQFIEHDIKEIVDTTKNIFNGIFSSVQEKWDCRYANSLTNDNIQARSRAMYLWGISNEFQSCLPVATSDKSELYMGYATVNGDMSGGIAPIGDITKTKLFALAKWLNKNRPQKDVIPESVILKRPGAELAIDPKTNKPLIAEDALMPYDFLDEIIWRVENNQDSYSDMLNSEFVYEKTHPISKEQKIEWLDKFYKRMSSGLYKRILMPTIINIESKYNYSQPITSCKVNYKDISQSEVDDILNKSV